MTVSLKFESKIQTETAKTYCIVFAADITTISVYFIIDVLKAARKVFDFLQITSYILLFSSRHSLGRVDIEFDRCRSILQPDNIPIQGYHITKIKLCADHQPANIRWKTAVGSNVLLYIIAIDIINR